MRLTAAFPQQPERLEGGAAPPRQPGRMEPAAAQRQQQLPLLTQPGVNERGRIEGWGEAEQQCVGVQGSQPGWHGSASGRQPSCGCSNRSASQPIPAALPTWPPPPPAGRPCRLFPAAAASLAASRAGRPAAPPPAGSGSPCGCEPSCTALMRGRLHRHCLGPGLVSGGGRRKRALPWHGTAVALGRGAFAD